MVPALGAGSRDEEAFPVDVVGVHQRSWQEGAYHVVLLDGTADQVGRWYETRSTVIELGTGWQLTCTELQQAFYSACITGVVGADPRALPRRTHCEVGEGHLDIDIDVRRQ